MSFATFPALDPDSERILHDLVERARAHVRRLQRDKTGGEMQIVVRVTRDGRVAGDSFLQPPRELPLDGKRREGAG